MTYWNYVCALNEWNVFSLGCWVLGYTVNIETETIGLVGAQGA